MTHKARLFILTSLGLFILVSFSCKKKDSLALDEAISRVGIVALQGSPIYIATGSDDAPELEWVGALDFGSDLRLAGDAHPRTFSFGKVEARYLPIDSNSKGLSALTASQDGKSYWIPEDLYAGKGAEAAVVSHDTSLRGGSRSLRKGTLVAVVKAGAGAGDFEAFVIDPMTRTRVENSRIPSGDISFAQTDVMAAILVAKALAARDEEGKRTFLEKAEKDFPDSIFAPEIKSMLGLRAEETGPAMEDLVAKLTVAADGAKVFAAPDLASQVLGTLALDEEVDINGRTAGTGLRDGRSSHWYRVLSPTEGWVFGLDLVGAD